MKTKETLTKQIYVTVVTSSLSVLATKIKTIVHPNEDTFDVCSEVANDIAKKHKLDYTSLLVQYYNNYSDEIPAMPFKVPCKPINKKQYSQEEVDELLDRQTAEATHKAIKAYKELNKKQFKQFDDKIFQAYIDKFDDNALEKAKRIIEAKQFLTNLNK